LTSTDGLTRAGQQVSATGTPKENRYYSLTIHTGVQWQLERVTGKPHDHALVAAGDNALLGYHQSRWRVVAYAAMRFFRATGRAFPIH
jgi:hypothetical protein